MKNGSELFCRYIQEISGLLDGQLRSSELRFHAQDVTLDAVPT